MWGIRPARTVCPLVIVYILRKIVEIKMDICDMYYHSKCQGRMPPSIFHATIMPIVILLIFILWFGKLGIPALYYHYEMRFFCNKEFTFPMQVLRGSNYFVCLLINNHV